MLFRKSGGVSLLFFLAVTFCCGGAGWLPDLCEEDRNINETSSIWCSSSPVYSGNGHPCTLVVGKEDSSVNMED